MLAFEVLASGHFVDADADPIVLNYEHQAGVLLLKQDYKEFLEELVKPEDKNATPFILGESCPPITHPLVLSDASSTLFPVCGCQSLA